MRPVQVDTKPRPRTWPRIWTHAGGKIVVPGRSLVDVARAMGLVPILRGGALLVPNQAEQIGLEYFLAIDVPTDLTVKLYTSDTTPGETHTEATYTEMTATMSYVDVDLTAGSWVVTPGAPTSAAYPQIIWTFSAGGPVSIYGYFIVRADGKLMWAERFTGAPFVVQNAGDQVKVTLAITLE
jgi:hypothetical protein